MKKRIALIAATGLAAAALPALVFATDITKPVPPLTDTERATIETQVAEMGYELVEIETEDDEIEVYANKDQQLFEIEFDRATGAILEIERED